MNRLREKNAKSLQDFLDGVLPGICPGSPDPDQQVVDKSKGESRPLLYSASLKRMESVTRQRTYLLLRDELMISEYSRLALEYPLTHSAMVEFVFTAPAGYQAILNMEKIVNRVNAIRRRYFRDLKNMKPEKAIHATAVATKCPDAQVRGIIRHEGMVMAKEPALFCRRGYEQVLDYLDEMGFELDVKLILSPGRSEETVDARQDKAREVFLCEKQKPGASTTDAIIATADLTKYSRRQIERMTVDLRAEEPTRSASAT